MFALRNRRWDPKLDTPEALWERLNDAWRDLQTTLIRTRDLADAVVTPRVTAPWPASSAYCSTAQAIANATNTVVALDRMDFADVDPVIIQTDLPRYRMVVKRSGIYRFTVRVGITAAAVAAGRIVAALAVNGDTTNLYAEAATQAAVGSSLVVICTGITSLKADDYVQAVVRQTTTGAQVLSAAASNRAQLQLEYVGGVS